MTSESRPLFTPDKPPSENLLMFLDVLAATAPEDLTPSELVVVLSSLFGTYAGFRPRSEMIEILEEVLRTTELASAHIEYEDQGGTSGSVH